MKHLFTFLFLLTFVVGLSGQAQAQRYTLTSSSNGQPPILTTDHDASPAKPGARQAADNCSINFTVYPPQHQFGAKEGQFFQRVVSRVIMS